MTVNLHAIVPAAGTGQRFNAELPKQFVVLDKKMVIEHATAKVLADKRVRCVHIVGSVAHAKLLNRVGDSMPPELRKRVKVHECGGATRALSVLAAAKIAVRAQANWLLVHDAVRPCLHGADLTRVIDRAFEARESALLAESLTHTLKQGKNGKSVATITRDDKWLAQTPQLAPAEVLCQVLEKFPDATDEAEALEKAGYQPQLVAVAYPNPKLTTQADLQIIAAILANIK